MDLNTKVITQVDQVPAIITYVYGGCQCIKLGCHFTRTLSKVIEGKERNACVSSMPPLTTADLLTYLKMDCIIALGLIMLPGFHNLLPVNSGGSQATFCTALSKRWLVRKSHIAF